MQLSPYVKSLYAYQLRTNNVSAAYLSHRSCSFVELLVNIVSKKSAWGPRIARHPTILIGFEASEKYALILAFVEEVGMSDTRVLAVAVREEPARAKRTERFL